MNITLICFLRYYDWFALLIFVVFACRAVCSAIRINKVSYKLKLNSTIEQCKESVKDIIMSDNLSFCRLHKAPNYNEMYPARPRFYCGFLIISIAFAILSFLYGLFLVRAALKGIFVYNYFVTHPEHVIILLLYGSLFAYFGIKDFISAIQSFKRKPINYIANEK